jgi:hypothetical protein
MLSNEVRVGQMVRLKTGGHIMQIASKYLFYPYQGWPLCVWSHRKEIKEAYIDPGLLETATSKPNGATRKHRVAHR